MTAEEFNERLASAHGGRWRAVFIWIVVFTAIVFFTLWKVRDEGQQRKTDRDVQVAAIVNAGNAECKRAFGAMTAILHASLTAERLKAFTPERRKRANRLFRLASPAINCPPPGTNKKILNTLTNKENQ